MRHFVVFFALAALLASPSSFAFKPLRSATGLAKPVTETVLRVRTAKVVLADYALLRKDFAAQVGGLSDAQIDEWLLGQTAFISRAQSAQSALNTPISVSEATRTALRPKDYGRALVYQVGPQAFIDVKGTGAVDPEVGGHSNGLATLGETTREFLYEKLINTLLQREASRFDTVGHYGVIDLGFDVIQPDGRHDPAGLILRQAHSRVKSKGSMLSDADSREAELLFRKYGITSAGAYRIDAASEQINIQGTPEGALLDFGGYLAVDQFRPVPARNFFGSDFLIDGGNIAFVQPDPRFRVPTQTWGYGVSGIEDPKFDNPMVWSSELATHWREGSADRGAFQTHFENLVGSYRRDLFRIGGEARPGVMEALVRALGEVH